MEIFASQLYSYLSSCKLKLNNTKDFNGIRSSYVRKEYTPTDHGKEVMVSKFIFPFLARAIIPETSAKIDVLSTIEMTSKCSKLKWNNELHFMIDKGKDHGKLLSISVKFHRNNAHP